MGVPIDSHGFEGTEPVGLLAVSLSPSVSSPLLSSVLSGGVGVVVVVDESSPVQPGPNPGVP